MASPISDRQLEELRGERGVAVAHSTLTRWVLTYAPEVERGFRRCQRPVGRSWRLDETDVKMKGKSAYFYRAVDREDCTSDLLLTPNRDRAAAEAFFQKALRPHGLPEKSTLDKSGSTTAAIPHSHKTPQTASVSRHSKDLKNIVEQDHRAVKRRPRPRLGFKSLWAARCTIVGSEVRPAIGKGQLAAAGTGPQTRAEQLYPLAA